MALNYKSKNIILLFEKLPGNEQDQKVDHFDHRILNTDKIIPWFLLFFSKMIEEVAFLVDPVDSEI